MCQAQPGPRCYPDSKEKLARLEAREGKLAANLSAAKVDMETAARKQDVRAYTKSRQTAEKLAVQHGQLQTQVRHVQRDLDSTKTGMRLLDDNIKTATSGKELRTFENRQKAARALRFARESAYAFAQSGRQPVLVF